ncbi:MAG: hypothetical protein RSE00_01755 [Clostridia bacterium]
MKVKLFMQKNEEQTLAQEIKESFEKKPKKAYFFGGKLREGGFKLIEEELDSKVKLCFAIGIDKKNTTRNMLEDILAVAKDLYVYSNNNTIEYDSNVCIFEYSDSAVMYVSSANLSSSGMVNNISLYTKVMYDFYEIQEKTEYKELIKKSLKEIENVGFLKITKKEQIEKLVDEKEIFTTNQYTHHNIKSISELLGKREVSLSDKKEETKQVTKEEAEDIYGQGTNIPKIDLSDFSIDLKDIDLSDVPEYEVEEEENENKELIKEDVKKAKKSTKASDIEVEYEEDIQDAKTILKSIVDNPNLSDSGMNINNEADDEFDSDVTLDINDLLFSKADVMLDVPIKKSKAKKTSDEENSGKLVEDENEVVQVKKVNLNNIANFIFELPAKPTKGQDVHNIKIPNYIQKMIPGFFELAEKGKNEEINGIKYKTRKVVIEVVDVKTNEKYNDRNAKIMHKVGQTYITFSTDAIMNIHYLENDIIRIIKLASDVYHMEIIPKEMQEYKLWSKLCTQNFKSSTRKYGMM